MSAKEWRKVVFSNEKKLNLDGSDGFQKYWHSKNFPEENYSTKHSGGRSLIIRWAFSSSGKLKQQFLSRWQKTADYVKILNDISFAQEGSRLCGEDLIFQKDNADIHNASITKKNLLEQKIRLLDHPVCSADLSPIENLWGLID